MISLANAITFLSNLAHSDVIKSNAKLFKCFNLTNLTNIADLFNSLYVLWDIEDNDDSLIFDKYKDLPNFNLLGEIYEMLKKIHDDMINIIYTNKELFISAENSILFLEKNLKEFEIKYSRIQDEDEAVKNYDDFYIFTQSKEELDNKLWTTFKFSGENFSYPYIVKMIEKHYDNELIIYYYNEKTKFSTRIKDEADFIEILNEVVTESRINKKPNITIKLYVDRNAKKIKYISQCINCGKTFEIEDNSQVNNLCEFCKNELLHQIVNNISHSTINSYYHK
jgi:hypothetical protein